MRTLLLMAPQCEREPGSECDQPNVDQDLQPTALDGPRQLGRVRPRLLGYHEKPDPRRQRGVVRIDLRVLPKEVVVIETRETALTVIWHPKPLMRSNVARRRLGSDACPPRCFSSLCASRERGRNPRAALRLPPGLPPGCQTLLVGGVAVAASTEAACLSEG
jgi:hypothetical protein